MFHPSNSTSRIYFNGELLKKPAVFIKIKTQTAVTNIYLNCITFINLTFRMLQHSKIQLYGLGTNEIG